MESTENLGLKLYNDPDALDMIAGYNASMEIIDAKAPDWAASVPEGTLYAERSGSRNVIKRDGGYSGSNVNLVFEGNSDVAGNGVLLNQSTTAGITTASISVNALDGGKNINLARLSLLVDPADPESGKDSEGIFLTAERIGETPVTSLTTDSGGPLDKIGAKALEGVEMINGEKYPPETPEVPENILYVDMPNSARSEYVILKGDGKFTSDASLVFIGNRSYGPTNLTIGPYIKQTADNYDNVATLEVGNFGTKAGRVANLNVSIAGGAYGINAVDSADGPKIRIGENSKNAITLWCDTTTNTTKTKIYGADEDTPVDNIKVKNIDVTTINGAAYPPPVPADNIKVKNIDVNTINGVAYPPPLPADNIKVKNIDVNTINGVAYPPPLPLTYVQIHSGILTRGDDVLTFVGVGSANDGTGIALDAGTSSKPATIRGFNGDDLQILCNTIGVTADDYVAVEDVLTAAREITELKAQVAELIQTVGDITAQATTVVTVDDVGTNLKYNANGYVQVVK